MNHSTAFSAFLMVACFALPGTISGVQTAEDARQDRASEFELAAPEGTVIPIALTAYISTKSSQAGDTVYADTTYPIWVQQRLVIPKGSTIRGTLTEVVRPGRVKGKGRIAVRFDDILLPNGVKRDISVSLRGIHGSGEESLDSTQESVEGSGGKSEDIGAIAGKSAPGAITGAIVGRGSGAAIGGGVGAAVGLATILFTRGRDLVLAPGTQFDLELIKPLRFTFNEIGFSSSELRSGTDVGAGTARPAQQDPSKR